jgi:hypothetical protein
VSSPPGPPAGPNSHSDGSGRSGNRSGPIVGFRSTRTLVTILGRARHRAEQVYRDPDAGDVLRNVRLGAAGDTPMRATLLPGYRLGCIRHRVTGDTRA